jgi:16S rRNA (guanine966-N2)-methyltransferase
MHIIAGKYKNRRLHSPKGVTARPTISRVREAVFNMCSHTIQDGIFLDLFAGSGAMGFEALSRGAQRVIFVERDKKISSCIRKNAEELGVYDNVEIHRGSVFEILPYLFRSGHTFTHIYADPPYNTSHQWKGNDILFSEHTMALVDSLDLLLPEGTFFLEELRSVDLEAFPTKTLSQKSCRSYGQTSLWQYIKS